MIGMAEKSFKVTFACNLAKKNCPTWHGLTVFDRIFNMNFSPCLNFAGIACRKSTCLYARKFRHQNSETSYNNAYLKHNSGPEVDPQNNIYTSEEKKIN